LLKLLATIVRHKVVSRINRQLAHRRDYCREQILGERNAMMRVPRSDSG
jgi:hypothetical protein